MAGTAMGVGMGVNALSGLFGAQSQSNTNNQNLQYALQRQNMMQGYVNQMLQPGMNPFGQAMLNFVGQGLPSGVPSFSTVPGQTQYTPPASNPGPATSNPGDPNAGGGQIMQQYLMSLANSPQFQGLLGGGQNLNGGQSVGAGQGGANFNVSPQNSASFSSAPAQSRSSGPMIPPGYTGTLSPLYSTVGGVDISKYIGQNLTMADLINQGVLTQANINQQFGLDPNFNPATDPGYTQQYQQWLQGYNANQQALAQNNNAYTPQPAPSQAQWAQQFGIDGTDITAYAPSDPTSWNQSMANLPQAPAQTFPGQPTYLEGGQTFTNYQQALNAMNAINQQMAGGGSANFGQLQPGGTFTPGAQQQIGSQVGGTPFQGISPSSPIGANGQMFQYQNPGAFTYNPSTLGQAPTIGGIPGVTSNQIQAPNASIGSIFQGAQANLTPNAQAQQIGGLPQVSPTGVNATTLGGLPQLNASGVNAQQISGLPSLSSSMVTPGSSQALNTGQDALMQMMRSNLQPASDPSLSLNLQQLGSGQAAYNTSDLFGSLQQQGQQQLNQQLSQLYGSAGSLGQRFGTAMMNDAGLLRTNATTNLNAQEQQIGMQAFNNAQALRQPALDASASLLGQQNQVGLANQASQLSAASQLAGLGQQGNQLDLQAQLANQSSGLQAQQGNLNALLQSQQLNQSAGLQAALANQGAGLQAQQGNLSAALQSGTANQNALLQAALANQSGGLQAQQANLNAALGLGTANQSASLQAALANQNLLGQLAMMNAGNTQQAGLAGQSLLGQLAQFNAGNQFAANQFNAQQGLQGQTTNLQAMMQAALANQGVMAQYGTNNANILNQAGQFNAQMGQSANQFNAQQGNVYNNLILQALSQSAGLQQGQSNYNAGLVGILNGVALPQAQQSPWASAIGNVGTTVGMIPFLNQAFNQGNAVGGSSGFSLPQAQIGSFTPNTLTL